MLVSPGRLGRIGSTALRLVPPAVPAYAVNKIIIQGDSISYYSGSANSYHRRFATYRSDKTFVVNADNSRSVGGAAWPGPPAEGADNGTAGANTIASMNTLLAQRPNDVAAAAQLLFTMIGTNDLATFSVANYLSRLATWSSGLLPTTRVCYSPPPSLNSGQQYAGYTAWMAKRATLMASIRNPAVWQAFATYYLPMGEHPDLNAADNSLYISNDGVHPNDAGHLKFYESFKPAMDALIDQARVNSTVMYDSAWPVSEAALAPATPIIRRFVVSGIAHTGLDLGASVSGSGAQIRLNGGAWGADIGTGSGNGYRIYNGDVIDISLTSSASGSTNTPVDLRVGSETRTINFTTSAVVSQVVVASAGSASSGPSSTAINFPGLAFVDGVAVVVLTCWSSAGGVVDSVPASLTLTPAGGGAAITLVKRMSGGRATSRAFAVYSAAITSGNYNLTGTRPALGIANYVSYHTLPGADPVPTAVSAITFPATQADPKLADNLTVPAFGIQIGVLLKETTAVGSAGAGSTLINTGEITNTGNTAGLVVVSRTTTGQCAMNAGLTATVGRGALAFKALGT